MQIRCNFPDISYLSEKHKNNFQFLNKQSEGRFIDQVLWVIEKVVKKRKRAGKEEYLVKYEGWPNKFNS